MMDALNARKGQTKKKIYCPPESKDVAYFGAECIIQAELDSIRKRRTRCGLSDHQEPKTHDLNGLALSGGGIRSASFSLGVMQALAYNNWLKEIDYLSTVSGGGYIGSSLTWSLNSDPEAFGLTAETFPFASFPMSGESRDKQERTPLALRSDNKKTRWSGRLLNFLRQNAKYLNPGGGLNLFALVWIALRGAALGLLVYGALITLLFFLAFQSHMLQEVCLLTFLPKALRQNGLLLLAVSGFVLCALTIPLYSLSTYLYQWIFKDKSYALRRLYERCVGWLLPFLAALLLLGIVPLAHDWVVVQGTSKTVKPGEFKVSGNLASTGELSFSGTMNTANVTKQPNAPVVEAPCASHCPEASLPAEHPIWKNIKKEVTALWAGLGTILIGLLSGIMAFFKTKSIKPGRIPLGLVVSLAVAALLCGVTLFAYTVAGGITAAIGCDTFSAWFFWGFALLIILCFAFLANINHISIHRYYRDRLMETFMPDVNQVLNGHYAKATASSRADKEPLCTMAAGPYHIVNANVVLVSSSKPKFRVRGGDNFILTPEYCGSYATGWRATEHYMGGKMTLASAMAISGAALNPSAGCGGEGITRSPVLSVLMGLLNFRLGYWAPNPIYEADWRKRMSPNFIVPGLFEILFRFRLNEKSLFLQLSDGGHFENLGLYELIRRKLKLIIVCDGGADPKFTFSDLANAMEKVRTDFGALIMITDGDLQALIPQKADKDGDDSSVPCARQPYLAANIKYADNSMGTLIYLTTTFFKGLSADLYGYKKENPAFPDESTGDQFFDEKQFEAYRELGFQAAWKMMMDENVIRRAWPEELPQHR